jgi:hypothetical protein
MRRAARTDSNHSEVVSTLRSAGCYVLSLAAIGGGVPDLLVWAPTIGYALLEVKDGSKPPSARKLTPDQQDWHRAWGGPVFIVTNPEEALRAVGALHP